MENPSYGSWGGRFKVNPVAMSFVESLSAPIIYPENNYITGVVDDFSSKRWLEQLQMDWASRSNWTVKSYSECNHAPIVSCKRV